MILHTFLIIGGGFLFIAGCVGYGMTVFLLRPKSEELDDYYYELEDQHPGLQRYHFWKRLFLVMIIISMLLMMILFVL